MLYRFKTAHASGAWSASQVDEVTAGSELKSIKNDKLDKNQGTANAGKYLKVGTDGNIETADLDVTTDKTLSIADKAADAKAVGDGLTDLKADLKDKVSTVNGVAPDTNGNVEVETQVGNFVEYTSKVSGENPPALIDKSDSVAGQLNVNTGEITTGSKVVSNFIDIRKAKRFYRSSTSDSKFLSDSYCLYDKDKNYLVGFSGNTTYTFETIDGHPNCVRFDLDTDGACYIRTVFDSKAAMSYYIVDSYEIYNAEIKEVVDARTDYSGTVKDNLAEALNSSYRDIESNFDDVSSRINALNEWKNIGIADMVFPYRSAKKVKITSESPIVLNLHGITVADAEHMGTVTYTNIEEVPYNGVGKKYRIVSLGRSGNDYRVSGVATGLTIGKTYRICLKVTDPNNDSTGGGHLVQLLCKTSVKSIGNLTGVEQVYTTTFTATAAQQNTYIYPFQTNGAGYTQAVGDEMIIEDWYINEINGDVDLLTHEACFAESTTGTELQYVLNGGAFVATGTGANVYISEVQSRLLTINGLNPDAAGNITVKSHLQGKNAVCFGDSITEKEIAKYEDYPYLAGKITGIHTINVGIGGTSMRYRTNLDTWNKACFANMADMIVSGDFTDIQTLGNTSGFEKKARCAELYPILSAIDWSDVDIITIAYGANDFSTSTVINNVDNASDADDVYTYLGAFRHSIETILAKYPHIQFLVLTPVFRFFKVDGNKIGSDDRVFEDISGNIHYYFWGDKLAECASNEYHIPVCDLYRKLGVSATNMEWFSEDGVHPNAVGIKRMGSHVASALMSNF